MAAVPLHLILSVITLCFVTSYAMRAKTYEIFSDSNGRQVCSIDQPTTVMTMTAGTMAGRCGAQCSVSLACKLYQFKDDIAQCELFNYEPENFKIVDKCMAYVLTDRLCPVGWMSAGYSCYKLIKRQFVGWQESTDYCSATVVRQKQAQLVVIDSEEKQRFIHKLLFTAYGEIFGYSNLALRKPASQSSDYGKQVANFSTDGNKNNRNFSYCSSTKASPAPLWWSVDLGNQSYVYGVNVTNRGDCCGSRLNNFIIALTNIKPYPKSSFPSNYSLCGQWPGVARLGATMFVGCARSLTSFRYAAIIITNTTNLNFCEAEVYGIRGMVWLAGRRQIFSNPNSIFIWNPSSNSSIPVSYSNWYNSTNPSQVDDWNCLAIDVTTGYWINTPCNSTGVYTLCELAV